MRGYYDRSFATAHGYGGFRWSELDQGTIATEALNTGTLRTTQRDPRRDTCNIPTAAALRRLDNRSAATGTKSAMTGFTGVAARRSSHGLRRRRMGWPYRTGRPCRTTGVRAATARTRARPNRSLTSRFDNRSAATGTSLAASIAAPLGACRPPRRAREAPKRESRIVRNQR